EVRIPARSLEQRASRPQSRHFQSGSRLEKSCPGNSGDGRRVVAGVGRKRIESRGGIRVGESRRQRGVVKQSESFDMLVLERIARVRSEAPGIRQVPRETHSDVAV